MSFNFPIKRQNHRVHPCQSEQKLELLKVLIEANSDKEIVVLTCKESAPIIEANKNVTVFEDKTLPSKAEKKYDLLISFDLPNSVKEYMLRIVHVKTAAVILLDTDEQHKLYPIETVLGRTILQEIITGFDSTPKVIEVIEEKESFKQRKEFKRDDRNFNDSKREYKPRDNRDAKPRENRDDKTDRKPRQDRDGAKPWDKKRETSKYIGDDENGKPMFSAKSRERNHRYDGTAKSDHEKADYKAKQKRARSYNDDKKPWDKSKSEGRSEKKPWDKSSSDKKPWDKSKSEGRSEKKPWDKSSSDKKPWDKSKSEGRSEKKPWDKSGSDKKPWDKSKSEGRSEKKPWDKKTDDDRGGKKPWDKPSGDKKSWDNERKPYAPKKTGKKIVIKSLKLPKK